MKVFFAALTVILTVTTSVSVAPAVNVSALTLGFNKDDYLGALVRLMLYYLLSLVHDVQSQSTSLALTLACSIYRYRISIVDISTLLKNVDIDIDIDMVIFENIDEISTPFVKILISTKYR